MKTSNIVPIKGNNNYQDVFRFRLEQLRVEHGLDKKELCQKIGCSTRIYSDWINGKYNSASDKTTYPTPSMDKLLKICNIFNVSLDYLFGRTDYTSVSNEQIHAITGLDDKAINTLTVCNSKQGNEYQAVTDTLNILLDNNTELLENIFNYILSDYSWYADNDGNPQGNELPLLNDKLLQVNSISVKKLNGALLQNITENIVELKNKCKGHYTFIPQPITYYLDKIVENNAQIEKWQADILSNLTENKFEYLQTIYGAISLRLEKNHLYEQIIVANYTDILKSKNFKSFSLDHQAILNAIYSANDYAIENYL